MAGFELRRFVHSIYCPIAILLGLSFCALGYIMQMPGYPQGVDLGGALLGTYVVLTQMGLLIIPGLVMTYVTQDFNDRNILFYRELGFTSVRYYVSKALCPTLFFLLGMLAGTVGTGFAYGDFSPVPVMLLHYMAVIFTYMAFYVTLACLLGSFIKSYFVNIVYSFGALYLALVNPALRFLQFFDQNGFVYHTLEDNILGHFETFSSLELPHLPVCFAYAAVIVVINVAIMALSNKRWLANGIR